MRNTPRGKMIQIRDREQERVVEGIVVELNVFRKGSIFELRIWSKYEC